MIADDRVPTTRVPTTRYRLLAQAPVVVLDCGRVGEEGVPVNAVRFAVAQRASEPTLALAALD